MRTLFIALLASLILLCPFVCGADAVSHGTHHGDASGQSKSDHTPDQCPEGSDNCVCRGAVQTGDVRLTSADAGKIAPFFVVLPTLHIVHPLHHLTWEGSPTGLAGWGNSLTIRALLQNYRC